jgi:hypothetical protein
MSEENVDVLKSEIGPCFAKASRRASHEVSFDLTSI